MRLLFSTGIVLAVLALTGCERSDVKVYHVAKEETSTPATTTEPTAPAATENANGLPQLHWTLPAGWTEKSPGEMRVASFTATGADGQTADIGVVPLPANGQEIQLVNMWREQLKLSAVTNVASEPVAIGDGTGKLFNFVSEAPLVDGKFPARILVAMLTRGEMSWFFKMTATDAAITAQKENFLTFLKSVSFETAAPIQAVTAPVAVASASNSIWQIPTGWQTADAGAMLFAKFSIADGDAKADVNISQLTGTGGGLLLNVNRWRGQLGLEPLDEAGLAKIVFTSGATSVVDFSGTNAKTGQPARLVAAVVPQNSQTWFYKLMGDEAVVATQKDAFLKFIESAKYPDAR